MMEKGSEMSVLSLVELLNALQVLEKKITVALMYSGLRVPQFRLLEQLDACGEATVTEISIRMKITRATASVMVNELVRAGIVGTLENPSDRRSFHVRLTELGRNKLQVARSDMAVMQDKISRQFSGETLQHLNAFAHQMLHPRERRN